MCLTPETAILQSCAAVMYYEPILEYEVSHIVPTHTILRFPGENTKRMYF